MYGLAGLNGWDHPRSRGVYQYLSRSAHGIRGSSPLARGLRPLPPGRGGDGRIIPARAGFTVIPAGAKREANGSSPLARGLQGSWELEFGYFGIIPARAGFTVSSSAHRRMRPDHPRSRGVYTERDLTRVLAQGSSPLARGLHAGRERATGIRGIIPARAGFTLGRPTAGRRGWDHPRSRGVYPPGTRRASPSKGSSPLARGLLTIRLSASAWTGIIPARAGFTRRPAGARRRQRDHPRSRGVYERGRRVPGVGARIIPARAGFTPRRRALAGRSPGSSPLARGLHMKRIVHSDDEGIIPARAGFTEYKAMRDHRARDHPRSRGVYRCRTGPYGLSGGSSPLARGLRRVRDRLDDGLVDHPRSRGVYRLWWRRPPPDTGSSPLARGLPYLIWTGEREPGIIPARAGFTCSSAGPRARTWDHPRSRGVYTSRASRPCSAGGSSPLARGLPLRVAALGMGCGIIPARAGFTGPVKGSG